MLEYCEKIPPANRRLGLEYFDADLSRQKRSWIPNTKVSNTHYACCYIESLVMRGNDWRTSRGCQSMTSRKGKKIVTIGKSRISPSRLPGCGARYPWAKLSDSIFISYFAQTGVQVVRQSNHREEDKIGGSNKKENEIMYRHHHKWPFCHQPSIGIYGLSVGWMSSDYRNQRDMAGRHSHYRIRIKKFVICTLTISSFSSPLGSRWWEVRTKIRAHWGQDNDSGNCSELSLFLHCILLFSSQNLYFAILNA